MLLIKSNLHIKVLVCSIKVLIDFCFSNFCSFRNLIFNKKNNKRGLCVNWPQLTQIIYIIFVESHFSHSRSVQLYLITLLKVLLIVCGRERNDEKRTRSSIGSKWCVKNLFFFSVMKKLLVNLPVFLFCAINTRNDALVPV